MWDADKIIKCGEDDFVRAYKCGEIIWQKYIIREELSKEPTNVSISSNISGSSPYMDVYATYYYNINKYTLDGELVSSKINLNHYIVDKNPYFTYDGCTEYTIYPSTSRYAGKLKSSIGAFIDEGSNFSYAGNTWNVFDFHGKVTVKRCNNNVNEWYAYPTVYDYFQCNHGVNLTLNRKNLWKVTRDSYDDKYYSTYDSVTHIKMGIQNSTSPSLPYPFVQIGSIFDATGQYGIGFKGKIYTVQDEIIHSSGKITRVRFIPTRNNGKIMMRDITNNLTTYYSPTEGNAVYGCEYSTEYGG